MQERQEYILKKLDNCERPSNIESPRSNFDVEEFLSVVDDLKNWDYNVFKKTSEDENSVRSLIILYYLENHIYWQISHTCCDFYTRVKMCPGQKSNPKLLA